MHNGSYNLSYQTAATHKYIRCPSRCCCAGFVSCDLHASLSMWLQWQCDNSDASYTQLFLFVLVVLFLGMQRWLILCSCQKWGGWYMCINIYIYIYMYLVRPPTADVGHLDEMCQSGVASGRNYTQFGAKSSAYIPFFFVLICNVCMCRWETQMLSNIYQRYILYFICI